VQEATAQKLLAAVVGEVQKGAKTIYLMISTPGGQMRDGFALYNILRGLPCEVVTHNVANVDSVGNVVFLAGARRYACANATFMFHGVGFDVQQAMRIEQKNAKELLDGISAETHRMAAIIESRATFANHTEVEQLFLEASTRDAVYAKNHALVHDILDVQIPAGSPLLQLVF
jgi:ATP-dependent protease ClpP protease subunit